MQNADLSGFAPLFSSAGGGTLAVVDSLARRVMWRQDQILNAIGNPMTAQYRMHNGKMVVWGYTRDRRHVLVGELNLQTGAFTKKKLDRRKASSLWRVTHQRPGMNPPKAVPGLQLKGGRLTRRDGKKVVWQTPADVKIATHYQVADNYALLKLAGNRLALVRLSDGKVSCRTGNKYQWPRIHKNQYIYFRNYFMAQPGNILQLRLNQRTPYHMVYLDMNKGKIVFDRKMPNRYTYPFAYVGDGIVLVNYREYKKEGKRIRFIKSGVRFMKPDGKFLSETFPKKEDIGKADARHFRFYPGPGILLAHDYRSGTLIGYVAAKKK